MTQDEIIRMAREAGIEDIDYYLPEQLSELERFAALVAEATKENAAKVCDEAVQSTKDAKEMLKSYEVIEKSVAAGAIYQAEKLAAAIRSMK